MTAVWDNFIGPLQMSNRYNSNCLNPDFVVEIVMKGKKAIKIVFEPIFWTKA